MKEILLADPLQGTGMAKRETAGCWIPAWRALEKIWVIRESNRGVMESQDM